MCVSGVSQIIPQKRPEIKKISVLYYASTVDSSAYTSQFIMRCRTTNRFDDFLVVPLGSSREDAIASLSALIEIFNSSSKDIFDIGEGIKAYSSISFETDQKELIIESKNCAGYAHLTIDGLIEAMYGLPLWNGEDELSDQFKNLNTGEKKHKLKYQSKKGWLLDGKECHVPHFINMALRSELEAGAPSNYQISDAVYNFVEEYDDFYNQFENK